MPIPRECQRRGGEPHKRHFENCHQREHVPVNQQRGENPNEHAEVASFKALEGKTWNHPVVVGDRLYIRNSQEAAGFQLPLAEAKDGSQVKQP